MGSRGDRGGGVRMGVLGRFMRQGLQGVEFGKYVVDWWWRDEVECFWI